jgi:hypothetical protein
MIIIWSYVIKDLDHLALIWLQLRIVSSDLGAEALFIYLSFFAEPQLKCRNRLKVPIKQTKVTTRSKIMNKPPTNVTQTFRHTTN